MTCLSIWVLADFLDM